MDRTNSALIVITATMFAAAPWIIHAAPHESTMGLVQKIFYFHMPAAGLFLILAMAAGVASAIFLFGKKTAADHWAVAFAEQVFIFGLVTLVTGPLWARKSWGVWWVWDARITSSLLLWIIFAAYLLLRKYGGPGSDKLAAGMALFGMANAPFIYMSVNYWRTLHPATSVLPTLPFQMGVPLWFCFAAFGMLSILLLRLRVRLERQRLRVEELYLAEDDA